MLKPLFVAAGAAILVAAPLAAQEQQMMKEKEGMQDTMPMAHLVGAGGHKATGSITLKPGAVVFGDDFALERNPDAYVVLSHGLKVNEGKALYLGKVSQFTGTQSYGIPAGTELSQYTHVVLWNKRAGVALGSAALPHGEMKKGMMDHDAMKKDEMKKDEMKQGEMKKDEMKKEEMKKPDSAMAKPN